MIPLGLALLVLCLAVPAWVYVGYPLLLVALAELLPRPLRRGDPTGLSVTVVVPAHDEERTIADKVADTLEAGRSFARLDVLVVSDGSKDGTVRLVRELAARHANVAVLDLPRVGKAVALNTAARDAKGDVLVFSDANARLEPGSLVALLAPFADPEVGGAAGNQRYRLPDSGEAATSRGESAYWSWDTWLKSLESRVGSCYAADGSLHALRRELYVPIEDPAQADDMAISMRVVTSGRRLVLAEDAVAWEDAPQAAARELSRKVRVTNHSLRSLVLLGPALWRSGFYSLELVSHKLLRHVTPLFLVAALALSLALAPWSPLARVLLVPQALVYGLGAAGWLLRGSSLGRLKALAVPYYFCLANAAALVGTLQVLRGRRIVSWQPQRGEGQA